MRLRLAVVLNISHPIATQRLTSDHQQDTLTFIFTLFLSAVYLTLLCVDLPPNIPFYALRTLHFIPLC